MKNKKFLAIIGIFIIIFTISIVSVYIIINTPDNIPPIVNITNPSEGESLSGTTTITFTATDQQEVIEERQILIDGVIIQNSSYSYTWDTTQEVDGSYTILCRAKDEWSMGLTSCLAIMRSLLERTFTFPTPHIV